MGKEFRKMLRRLEKKRLKDGEWRGSRKHKHKKKKKSHKKPTPEKPPTEKPSPEKVDESVSSRSRPRNLRQKPTQRYQDALDELEQEEEFVPKSKARVRPSLAHESSPSSESSHDEGQQDE